MYMCAWRKAIFMDSNVRRARSMSAPEATITALDQKTWSDSNVRQSTPHVATLQNGEGITYLDDAVMFYRETLALFPQGHPHRPASLNNLVACLWHQHNQQGTAVDLDEAIVLGKEALKVLSKGHPRRSNSLDNLAFCLRSRFKLFKAKDDLDEVIALRREALALSPQGHPHRSVSLNNLAASLWYRWIMIQMEITSKDLDEAIALGREALELRPQGYAHRSISMNNLASCLRERYQNTGEIADLNEAILLSREALEHSPRGRLDCSFSLDNPESKHARSCYKQFGETVDLDEAIAFGQEVLEVCARGHPRRSDSLDNLAFCLRSRYLLIGALVDLDAAISFRREALELCPQGHPHRASSLNNLAFCLWLRYKHVGETEALDAAITLVRESLELRPRGHIRRSTSLGNLASWLCDRYKEHHSAVDLEAAVAFGREALNLRPQGHPHRSLSLRNLALCLSARYKQFCAVADLDEAIVLGREALELRPQGYPGRSDMLRYLTDYLRTRFTQLGHAEDEDALFSSYAQLVDVPQVVSFSDLSAAQAWISDAEDFQHPSTLLAYDTSLRLLVQYLSTLPSLPQHLDVLKKVTSSLAVDAFSACLRNCAPRHAIELLVRGRGVFWSQLARLRFSLDDVIASGPDGEALAEEFKRFTSLIRSALNPTDTDQHDRVYHLNTKLKCVVTKIRELPGLSHFLLPLPFSDLQRAASGGPVVIVNASQYGCDALVVLHDRNPVRIPLPITQEHIQHLASKLHTATMCTKSMDVTRDLGLILRELWDLVVSRVVTFLQTVVPLHSRIWWCPTAEFSLLPLHAAGPYRKGQKNLANLYISSYTPTLSALISARRPSSSRSENTRKRFVAIGQANAVGESELLSVSDELANIGRRVDGLIAFTQIEGPEACSTRVAQELNQAEWVHLACHGVPNPKRPFESAFALHDERFTIERIVRCDLRNPEFAYLSACHTTVGDEESPDEVLHLAAAMHFAGFRSVIGTMWAVDDGETGKITSRFYEHMVDASGQLDYTRAAYALNKTVRSVDVPLDQRILYIHLGA